MEEKNHQHCKCTTLEKELNTPCPMDKVVQKLVTGNIGYKDLVEHFQPEAQWHFEEEVEY